MEGGRLILNYPVNKGKRKRGKDSVIKRERERKKIVY